MSEYRRKLIIEWFVERAETIRTSNGFATNAGLAVYTGGIPELGPNDPDVALAIMPGRDLPKWAGAHILLHLPMEIAAVAKASIADPYLAAEAVLGDMKKAFEVEDRRLGGLLTSDLERGSTHTTPRPPNSTTVGVSLNYTAPYKERWGHPEV